MPAREHAAVKLNNAFIERYAMQAEQAVWDIYEGTGWLEAKDVGAQLNLSEEDSLAAARQLCLMGWASPTSAHPGRFCLTPYGLGEIAKLRRPSWQRWADKHPVIVNVFWMTATGVVSGLVVWLFTRFF